MTIFGVSAIAAVLVAGLTLCWRGPTDKSLSQLWSIAGEGEEALAIRYPLQPRALATCRQVP